MSVVKTKINNRATILGSFSQQYCMVQRLTSSAYSGHSKREGWIGIVVATNKTADTVDVLWLCDATHESIEEHIQNASDIDALGVRRYTGQFIRSERIQVFMPGEYTHDLSKVDFPELAECRFECYTKLNAVKQSSYNPHVQEENLPSLPPLPPLPPQYYAIATAFAQQRGVQCDSFPEACKEARNLANKYPGVEYLVVQVKNSVKLTDERF